MRSSEWLETLKARNARFASHPISDLYQNYKYLLDQLVDYQSRLFHYEKEIAVLRGQKGDLFVPSVFDWQKQKLAIEAKLTSCQEELALAYKVIQEKSDLALNIRNQQSNDSKDAQELRKKVEDLEGLLSTARNENEDLKQESKILRESLVHQQDEIKSLREIQETLQRRILELNSENKQYLEEVVSMKSKQAEEMNKMNDIIKALKEKSGNTLVISTDDELDSKEAFKSLSISERRSSPGSGWIPRVPSEITHSFNTGAEISATVFDQSGKRFLSGGVDKIVRLWSISESRLLAKLSGPEKSIIDVDISFDASLALSAGHDPGIYIWSMKNQKLSQCLNGHTSKICCAKFYGKGTQKIFSGSYDRSIKIWDVESSSCSISLPCISSCHYVDCSADENMLCSAHLDSHIRFWDVRSKELIQDISNTHSKSVSCVKFSTGVSPHLVISAGKDSILQIIDSRTWKNVRTLKDPEFKNPSSINWSQFAISPDGVYTVCGSESGALIVWEIESGKRNRYLKGHLNAVTCCSWSSNGTNIVSADKEGILNVWS